MKRAVFLVWSAVLLGVGFSVQAKTLKVLMIGNSFSVCVLREMPACAASMPGCTLDLCSLYIGGCSLERHWRNLSTEEAAFRPYAVKWSYATVKDRAKAPVASAVVEGKANIPEVLRADRWDVVTIQQASHESWKPASYHPFGDRLVEKIRELAPQARIVVQQTWSYTPYDARLKKWGFDQNEMYRRLREAYAAFAAQHGLSLIPMGDAVQLFRAARPSPDGITGDPCGNPTGHDKFHLNRNGEYLQACTWLAALFGVDVTKMTYAPSYMSAEEAACMRRCAQKAVEDGRVARK